MSGPYGPNDAPGTGEGRNDPTQVWGGQQPPGAAPQWGNQPPAQPPVNPPDPQQAQPTQQWGSDPGNQQWQPAPPQPQQWSQPQPQPQQPQPQQWEGQQQWGQQQPQQPPQQWGDPNQQQPQWSDPGQQQWGQQPQAQSGQWGQPGQQQWAGQQQPSGGGKKTGLIVGLSLLAVVLIAGAVVLILTLTAKDELDQAAVQTGVAKVLGESYGIEDVKDVQCPAGQEVAVDATFTCDLKVGGEAKKVNVKITKDDGTYEVGRPS
ncbi:DUF4333 domain-containing protein [Nocardia sp. NBC_00416]|uniref:DUF4333 domain-containing protein n=1 Tax=Nocardia sp. NBC_00416 TaxID=2975991 RepID=UPI002E1E7571